MRKYTINGIEYPFLFSINAIRGYMDNLSEPKDDDKATNSVDEVQTWIELGLKYGSKADGFTYDIKSSDVADWMDANFETVCEIGGFCRKQMQIFNNALTGKGQPESNGEAKKKTAKA